MHTHLKATNTTKVLNTHPISFSDRDGLKLSRGSSGGATPFTFNPCLSRTCGKKQKTKKNRAQLSGKDTLAQLAPKFSELAASKSISISEKQGKLVMGENNLVALATPVVAASTSTCKWSSNIIFHYLIQWHFLSLVLDCDCTTCTMYVISVASCKINHKIN